MKVDLRSDTVTKPTSEMREIMAQADVGDDVFMEDPTVNALEEKVADFFGHEAGLYCSSGTMTNQIAIAVHTGPGKEVICHKDAHIYQYEGGGIARNAGASVFLLEGNRGRIAPELVTSAIQPDDVHKPETALISLEDTANRGGGAVYDFENIKKIKNIAMQHDLPLHLDGARVMNALMVNGIDAKDYGAAFDSISLCLSKGLGAPVGSVLTGSKDFIKKARRVRKVFGGGMRQAGIIAAAGIYALDHHVLRLKEDHLRAKTLEAVLLQLEWVKDVMEVATNIVVFEVDEEIVKAKEILEQLKQNNIFAVSFGGPKIRFVTHLDYNEAHEAYVLEKLKHLLD